MKVQNPAVRSRCAGALLLLAGVQYVVLEYIAAHAWHSPTHSYAVNFVSDLGNPVAGDVFDGRLVNSPLHLVMDAGFIAQGALFIAAGLQLVVMVTPLRPSLLWLAFAHGVGVILVGFFPESSAALHDGVIVVHSIGAAGAIIAGNVIAIVIGARGDRLGAPRWLRAASAAFGLLGLAAFVLLQADRPLYHADGGVPERASVYTIVAFESMVGAALLLARVPYTAPVLPVRDIANRSA